MTEINKRKIISIVIPVYNEELTIDFCHKTLRQKLTDPKYFYEIVFVNDGSQDRSSSILSEIREKDDWVKVVEFSRNFGQDAAILAGLEICTGDVAIPFDVDLQDPVEVISQMIKQWEKSGADVVLPRRRLREGEGFFKRASADCFYKISHSIFDIPIAENVGYFRLLSRECIDNLKRMQEKNVFLKGMFAWSETKRVKVLEYDRDERTAGSTKYSFKKLVALAVKGFINFSKFPLLFWLFFGIVVVLFSFVFFIVGAINPTIFITPQIWNFIIFLLLLLIGLMFISVGVLGLYVYNIMLEVKNRPRYTIKKNKDIL